MKIVLDASAVIAYLNGESGADSVGKKMRGAGISSVNLAEVVTKLIDQGVAPVLAERSVDLLALSVIPFDAQLALDAARLRVTTRAAGLSLGDRACLATAQRERAIA